MMAAVQPFISGAISKTVNLPESATPQDIYDAYVESWELGLKAVAIYRENSKRSQPLSTKKGGNTAATKAELAAEDRVQADLFAAGLGDGGGSADAPSVIGSTVEQFMAEGAGRPSAFRNQEDAPGCPNCGSITVRAGSCYSCPNCGTTTGCG